jgi:cytochrome c peroxidase
MWKLVFVGLCTVLAVCVLALHSWVWAWAKSPNGGVPAYPATWPKPLYNFQANPPTSAGIALGKKLFYDGLLSADGYTSCASCHQQFAAFSTYDHPLSHGVNNQFSLRNAPGLFNLAWHPNYHLDGGITHLDAQPLAPITATNEMGETLENVIQRLQNHPQYPALFQKAFGSSKVSTRLFTKAISQFLVTLVSANSKYDRVMAGTDTFNLPQRLGYELFMAKGCAGCHTPPLFTNFTFENIGLPIDSSLNDYGRMRVTQNPQDSLRFKVPSLRNVQLTMPYTHDGRFSSIDQVLQHYNSGVVAHASTSSQLRKGISLTKFQMGQIKAFLYTLTDTAFVKNKAFADAVVEKPGIQHHP